MSEIAGAPVPPLTEFRLSAKRRPERGMWYV